MARFPIADEAGAPEEVASLAVYINTLTDAIQIEPDPMFFG